MNNNNKHLYIRHNFKELCRLVIGSYTDAWSNKFVMHTMINWLKEPVFDSICTIDETHQIIAIKELNERTYDFVINTLRKRLFDTWINENIFFAWVKKIIPYCNHKNFENILTTNYKIADEYFHITKPSKKKTRKRTTRYINKNAMNDIVTAYNAKFAQKKPVLSLSREQKQRSYIAISSHLKGEYIRESRVPKAAWTEISINLSGITLNQMFDLQLSANFSNEQYIPYSDKKETLLRTVNTIIERLNDLEKLRNNPNPKREEKIKSIIKHSMFSLKNQADYIKRYFNKDINIIIEKYESGQNITAAEIKSFFNIPETPQLPPITPEYTR